MRITFFKSETDTYVSSDLSLDLPWSEIVEILTTFTQVDKKESTEMYNLWEFVVRNNTIHRCKDDCLLLHGLVLDYDQNLSLSDAIEKFAGIECVIYTTFNHYISGKDKYRVILPFKTPMPVEDFNKKRKSIIDTFVGVDRASFSRSQAIFLHSGPVPTFAYSTHITGDFLDWTAFEDEVIIEYEETAVERVVVDPTIEAAYRKNVIDSLLTCSGFRYMDSMSIVIILKSCGASIEDFRRIANKCGDSGSGIRDQILQQHTWNAVSDDVRIRKGKRDKFIADHGGRSKFTQKESEKLLDKMRSFKIGSNNE